MRPKLKPLAITAGEPAGIGVDLLAMLTQMPPLTTRPLVLLADRDVLQARAQLLGFKLNLPDYDDHAEAPPPLSLWHFPTAVAVQPKVLNPKNATHVLALLEAAVTGCERGQFAGMMTAPVHKGVINDAGIAFTGHTEWLARRTKTPRVVMMLVGGGLRVALATTHLPLRAVADAITPQLLCEVIDIIHHDLTHHFGVQNPMIAVAGLNPHAGEGGHLGEEELWMRDLFAKLREQKQIRLSDPLPADTLFHPERLRGVDVVLSMYHDQGLPVLKFASFGAGVNVTLGLPLIRTSVDHGTALDLVGTGRADLGSLRAAIELADQMAHTAENGI